MPARDPYWLTLKWNAVCSQCGADIPRGQRVFYYPNGRRILCAADHCGGQASRDFNAAIADERNG